MTANAARRLRERLEARQGLLGAVVSSGMAVSALEDAGPAAAFMPYGNANELTWRPAREQVLPAVRRCPVFLGVCAHDPTLDADQYLEAARQAGVVGIANYPTLGNYDGANRQMPCGVMLAGTGRDDGAPGMRPPLRCSPWQPTHDRARKLP